MIQPTADNVLITVIKEEKQQTKSGILLPGDSDKKPPVIGTVIAVGPEAPESYISCKVIFAEYGFDPIKVDDVEYQIGPLEKILAVIIE